MTSDDIRTLTISSISVLLRNKTSQVCHWFSTLSTYFGFEELIGDATDIPQPVPCVVIYYSQIVCIRNASDKVSSNSY